MTLSEPENRASDTPVDTLLERYRVFDALFEAEIAASPPATIEASLPRLLTLIDALPQRQAIEDRHVDRWIERTLSMARDRMALEHGTDGFSFSDVHRHVLWHVRRASGIGGSEIGTIVKHFRGERGNFTNARNLVLEKLLILSPQPSTPEMSRGVRAEPWIQAIYQAKTGHVTDTEHLARLRGFRWSKMPVLNGTPDDIVIQANARRRLVDYKAPSADVCAEYEKDGISFDYVCQLHHYGIIAVAAGSRFHDMSIEVLDPRSFEVVSYPIAIDRDLMKEIMASARQLWVDHVMTGMAPDAPTPDALRVDDPALIRIGHEAAMFRAMKEAIEKREKEWLERIALLGSEMHDKAVGKMALGVADYTRARAWDVDKLTSLATAAGIDPADYMVEGKALDDTRATEILSLLIAEVREQGDPSALLADLARNGIPLQKKLDADALAEALQNAGIDTIEAAGIRASFGLSRKKKGPEAETVARLRDGVAELVEALDDVVQETAEKLIRGEEEVDTFPEP